MFKKTRSVRECGKACHIYVPQSLLDKEVVGLILKDNSIVETNDYKVSR